MFEDYATDLHMKRMIRDYIHYDDIVYCTAYKIILKLNKEAKELNRMKNMMNRFEKTDHIPNDTSNGDIYDRTSSSDNDDDDILWSSIHIRHGELQYTNVQISPLELLDETRDWLNRTGELLYIGTDETDLRWFKPLEKRHKV